MENMLLWSQTRREGMSGGSRKVGKAGSVEVRVRTMNISNEERNLARMMEKGLWVYFVNMYKRPRRRGARLEASKVVSKCSTTWCGNPEEYVKTLDSRVCWKRK